MGQPWACFLFFGRVQFGRNGSNQPEKSLVNGGVIWPCWRPGAQAATLKEKCLTSSVRTEIGVIEGLTEIWETFDTCYGRPEKYIAKAPEPLIIHTK
jgi:hypothetical protein